MPERPTVVFLHGQPGTSVDSLRLRRALPSTLRLLAPDRPGYGTNPEEATGFFGNADFALRMLDDLGVEAATFVGHSWGGGIALRLAQRHPDRVDALVLAASVGPGCLNWVDRVLAAPVLGEVLTAPSFVLGAPLARPRFRRLVGLDAVDEEERARAERSLQAGAARSTWRAFLVEQRALYSELPTIEDELEKVVSPTTVVAGSRDHFIPTSTARALAQAIPDAHLDIIDGVGHVLQLRTPAALARVVVETVARAGTH